MTNQEMPHPPCLCALHIVRISPEAAPGSQVAGAAALIVHAHRGSARFAVKDLELPNGLSVPHGLAEFVACIPHGASVLYRSAPPTERIAGDEPRSVLQEQDFDWATIEACRQDVRFIPFQIDDDALKTVAEYFAVRRAGPDANLAERLAQASEEAQALWLAYLFTCIGQPSRRSYAAAYQAWRALRAAMPVSFGPSESF